MRSVIMVFALSVMIMLPELKSQAIDTTSYSIGMSLGERLKSQGAKNLDYSSVILAIQDILEKKDVRLNKALSDSLNFAYFQNQRNNMFADAKKEGEDFLATNGQRPEVTTTESGLQYEVLTPAEGPKPTSTTSVTVHYVGKLINGDMFDSSVERGQPATFPLNRVIPGWTEGLQLMSTGAKYRFFIPSELAYGSRGAGQAVPPFSTLIFDVELLKF